MSDFNKDDFKAECTRRRENGFVLKGKGTYEARDEIKAAGGIWDKMQKAWLMPDQKAMDQFAGMNEGSTAPPETETQQEIIPDDAF